MLKMALTFVVFIPKPHNPSLIMGKPFKNSQLRNILQNTSLPLLETVKVIKKKGMHDKLLQPQEAKEPINTYNVLVNLDGIMEQKKDIK